MTTLLISLLVSLPFFSSPAFNNSPSFSRRGQGVVPSAHLVAIPRDCYTFTIDNVSSDTLGDVTISGGGSYADFNVTGSGFFQQNLCFAAVSVTINNVIILYPNSGNVQLPSGAWVKAGWQSPSLVEVANKEVQNSPQP